MQTQRRALLRAVACAAMAMPASAACDLFKPDPPPPPDPLTDFYTQTLALLTAYESAGDTRPAVAAIREAHRAHAAALAKIMTPPPPSAGPAPPSAKPTGAMVDLRTAEQAAWQKAVEICHTAPAERATLIGEIAVARACHLEALT